MRNRICSIEYINTLLKLSLLSDVEKPIDNLDMLQYDLSTGLWKTTTTLTGITLGTPWTLAGDGSWTGASRWTISDAAKEIEISDNNLGFVDTSDDEWLVLSPTANAIFFGNTTDNPTYSFLGTGGIFNGGDLEFTAATADIGLTTDPSLIQLGLVAGQVDVNGDLVVTGTYNTMAFDVFGTNSMKIGVNAGSATGTSCVFIGPDSGNDNTGDNNIAVGDKACGGAGAGTSGSGNVCVGRESGRSLTSGMRNFALGQNALQLATTTSDNVSIGSDALKNITTNTGRNVAIGFGSMQGSSGATANNNVCIGYASGFSMTSALENTCIGYRAGAGLTQGFRNSLLGYESGDAINTGDYNVCVGWRAGDNLTTGNRGIIIGSGIDAADATTDYQLNIGDAIVGILGGGSERINILHNVRIGDTTAPTLGALEVKGKTLLGTPGTTDMVVDADGHTYWVGDSGTNKSGLPYGSMFQYDTTTTVDFSTAGTTEWVEILNWTTGADLNAVTYSAGRLTALKAGRYLVSWSISWVATNAATTEWEVLPYKNATTAGTPLIITGGTQLTNISAHRSTKTTTDRGNMAATGIVDLAANDTLSLAMINETNNNNATIEHATFSMVHIGGT